MRIRTDRHADLDGSALCIRRECAACKQRDVLRRRLSASMSNSPIDGRIILLVAKGTPSDEPRAHVSPDEPLKAPFMFASRWMA